MKIGIISFTARGGKLSRKLLSCFQNAGDDCQAWVSRRVFLPEWEGEGVKPLETNLGQWTGERFAEGRGIIFVGAVGIAVRAIAPWVCDKMKDPPVVAVDEAGNFAVPLLSGHVGGANELARRVGRFTGAVPVITTATDVNQVFAVDLFAVENGLVITDRREAKEISASLLAGEPVGFFSDFPGEELPPGCKPYACRHNIWVTLRAGGRPEAANRFLEPEPGGGETFLRLVPRQLVLGTGCRRGTAPEVFEERIREIFREENLDLAGVKALATIDRKRDEEALLRLAGRMEWELRFYSAGELAQVEGEFSESEFVHKTVDVGNVCERAACAEGGRLLMGRRAGRGITAAAALEQYPGKRLRNPTRYGIL